MRSAVLTFLMVAVSCAPEPVEKAPTAAQLDGTYALTKETRDSLSKLSFWSRAGSGPDIPPGTFKWDPGTIELSSTGDFKAEQVPQLEGSFFGYGGEFSCTGTWITVKRGPQVFVVLSPGPRSEAHSELLLYRTPTGYALGAQIDGDLNLMFAR